MQLPRICHAVAKHLPCSCHDVAVMLPSSCHAAMELPCSGLAVAMQLPCSCPAVAMQLPCSCHAVAMRLPCCCHDVACRCLCMFDAVFTRRASRHQYDGRGGGMTDMVVDAVARHLHVQGRLALALLAPPLLPVPSPFVPPPWGKPGCAPEVAARQPWPSPSASARARRATSARRRRFFSSRCAPPGRRGTSDTLLLL